MLAKLVQGTIDPARVEDAACAVEEDLIPLFLEHPGARQGFWMANRDDGHVLVMTCWSDQAALEAGRSGDGEERTRVAERLGLRITSIRTLDVLGVEETGSAGPVRRWARATWVDHLPRDLDSTLRAMHREVVAADVQTTGFGASYWLADHETGSGVELSLWNDLAGRHANEPDSRRRRRWFERTVGCHIDHIARFEALGVVAPTTVDLTTGGMAAAPMVAAKSDP